MTIELELQIASDAKTLPHPSQFREWISVAIGDKVDDSELTIRIVDLEESAELNYKYRDKNKPTNVLSFPSTVNLELEWPCLGDIIICAPIVEQEAKQHNIELLAHWAHIVIHGALHLLGFDHKTNAQAKIMEDLENKTMIKLGFKPPFGDIEVDE